MSAAANEPPSRDLPSEMRELLVCPQCRGALRDASLNGAPVLVCAACAKAYPVEDGIPVLLAERASQWHSNI